MSPLRLTSLTPSAGKMELSHWTDIWKTGKLKEVAPYDPNWHYIRAVSMARKIYQRGGLGIGGFVESIMVTRGMAADHNISSKAVVPQLVTFFSN